VAEVARHEGPLALAHLLLLAHRRDWKAWPKVFEEARVALERDLVRSENCSIFAGLAADLAEEAGHAAEARQAQRLAELHGCPDLEMPTMLIVDGMLARLPGRA